MKKVIILILMFAAVSPTYSGCWEYSRVIGIGSFARDWDAGAAYGDSLYLCKESILYNYSSSGVYGGSILWRTTDQGKTFTMYYGFAPNHPTLKLDTIPGVGVYLCEVNKIIALNADTIYMITDTQFLIKTEDGGKNWTKIKVMSEYDDAHAEFRTLKDCVVHGSGLGVFCYQAVRLNKPDEYKNIRDSILLTIDDWATVQWVNINKMENKQLRPWRAHIVDSNNIWVICRIDEESCMVLANSTDKGSTWTNMRLPGNPSLLGIDFINKNLGWIGGCYYNSEENKYVSRVIFKTSDGGLNWEKQLDDTSSLPGIRTIKFINDQEGYAYCSSPIFTMGSERTDFVVYHTIDGGTKWERQYPDTMDWKIGEAVDMSIGSLNNSFIAMGPCIFKYNADCTMGVSEGSRPPMPEELKVYPNPIIKGGTGTLEVGNTNDEILESVYLYDISGSKISDRINYTTNTDGQFEFKLSAELPSGTYMIVLQYGINRIKYCRVVVE